MTSWFGHEDQLEQIAVDIDTALAEDGRFNRELGSIGLDPALFSASVRCGIASRKAPASKPVPLLKPAILGAALHA